MSTLSRRGFLVLGGSGAAGVALGGCGSEEDPRGEGRDPELLGDAIAAETAYGAGAKAFADQQGVSQLIDDQSSARVDELKSLSKGEATAPGDSSAENVNEAAQAAIVAYRSLARFGSTEELRMSATRFVAQVAGELAAVRELGGDDEVPYAFVTGLPEPPLQSADDAPSAETTTSTTSTTTAGG